jgi:hypothetical protein
MKYPTTKAGHSWACQTVQEGNVCVHITHMELNLNIMNIQSIVRFERGRLSTFFVFTAIAVLMAIPVSSWAVPPPYEGTLTLTPDDPIPPIPVGPPGIDILADWVGSSDLTRFKWSVDTGSQGTNNVADGEGSIGEETQNFIFIVAGDYQVCFHVYHHQQQTRDLNECVTVQVADVTCEWVAESAMSDGDDYLGANWFTYTAYPGYETSATLCAGSTCLDAGTVTFSAPDSSEVTVTIDLNSGWRFKDDDENVKIQDYASVPTEKAIPGQFSFKSTATTSPYSAPPVPDNSYYGVHVDVERCVLE